MLFALQNQLNGHKLIVNSKKQAGACVLVSGTCFRVSKTVLRTSRQRAAFSVSLVFVGDHLGRQVVEAGIGRVFGHPFGAKPFEEGLLGRFGVVEDAVFVAADAGKLADAGLARAVKVGLQDLQPDFFDEQRGTQMNASLFKVICVLVHL